MAGCSSGGLEAVCEAPPPSSYGCWRVCDDASECGGGDWWAAVVRAVRQGRLEDVKRRVEEAGGAEAVRRRADSWRLAEECVRYGRVCGLRLVVGLGGAVERETEDSSPLHLACRTGRVSLARCLVEAGADVDRRDAAGRFPLHYAANSDAVRKEMSKYGRCRGARYYRYVSHSLALLLLDAGARYLDCLDRSHLAPLHYAVMAGDRAVASLLLERGADVDLKGNLGRTPLWCAVYSGDTELAGALLAAGASPLCTDLVGHTLLHTAVRLDDTSTALFLLRYFADNGLLERVLDARSVDGDTCLHYSAAHLNHTLTAALVGYGASVNRSNYDGCSPLYSAVVGRSHEEYIPQTRFLGRPWCLSPDSPACTSSDTDTTCRYCRCVSFLLKNGADVDHRNNKGETPLHVATKRGLVCCGRLLLDGAAQVDARDDDGLTPLHLAVEGQVFPMAELLLRRGADPDAKGEEYLTPLHLVAVRAEESSDRTLSLLSLLLEYGADVDARYVVDMTPLYLVLRNALDGQYSPAVTPSIVDLFLSEGADVFASTFTGRSPLGICLRRLRGPPDPCPAVTAVLRSVYDHAVKVVAARLKPLSSDRLVTDVLRPTSRHTFYLDCLSEIESMKRKLVSTDSFFDVLALNTVQLSRRLRNTEYEKYFLEKDYLTEFPIYASLIESKLKRAWKRKDNFTIGHRFFRYLSDSFSYPRLPFLCVEFVLKHLGVVDFNNIQSIIDS